MPILLLYASCSFALAYASKELLIFLLNVAQVVIASRSSFVRICATVDGSELRKFRVVGGVVQVRAIFRRCFLQMISCALYLGAIIRCVSFDVSSRFV